MLWSCCNFLNLMTSKSGSLSNLDFCMNSYFNLRKTSLVGIFFLYLLNYLILPQVCYLKSHKPKHLRFFLPSNKFLASSVRLSLLIKLALVVSFRCSIGPDCSTVKIRLVISFKMLLFK